MKVLRPLTWAMVLVAAFIYITSALGLSRCSRIP